MKNAFDGGKADFTGIHRFAKPDDWLYVSQVFHKAFVAVDEKGAEAAAATAVPMARAGSAPPTDQPVPFVADHPFLFVLHDRAEILFIGRVVAPHSSKLYSLRFVCLVRKHHPRVGKRLSLARFLELEHVLVAPGGTPRDVIDDLLRARELERRVALTLAHFFSAAMVVSVSDLVMSATSVLADVAARILPVRVVPHPLGAPAVAIGMKWDRSRAEDPALGWLRATLTEVARREVR